MNKVELAQAAEDRRVQLNESLKDNQRIKLGVSRANWKKLKKFEVIRQKAFELQVTGFYTEIISKGLNLGDVEVEEIFDLYEKQWRAWCRTNLTKLNLHSKVGRDEIFEQFTTLVHKAIKQSAQKEAEKIVPHLNEEIMVKIITEAITLGAAKNEIHLENYRTYTEAITALKEFVPRGKKVTFEKMAKRILKDTAKELGVQIS